MLSMVGAIVGAFSGPEDMPPAWLASLEDGTKGASYMPILAQRLVDIHLVV